MSTKSNNESWNIGRDSNINPTLVYGFFLYRPLIDDQTRETGNIAAKKSDMIVDKCCDPTGEPSFASKLLLEGKMSWNEYIIHLLTSRGNLNIKPIVAICKFIVRKLEASKSKYDVFLKKEDIEEISTAANYQELSSLPGSANKTKKSDIWFNVLEQTGLFFKPGKVNGKLQTGTAYLIRTDKVEALIKFIASEGENFDTDYDTSKQLGGICSVLNKEQSYEFKDLIPNLVKHGYKTTTIDFVSNSQQLVCFGAPGTGKSHFLDKKISATDRKSIFRTTFHPEYDYAQFVGCYKPTEIEDAGKRILSYRFVPQAFIKAYVEAWRNHSKKVFLLIEEINRGNCAQIFGDIFQLLDRSHDGFSKYPITPSSEIQQYLEEEFQKSQSVLPEKIACGQILKLPPNLSILGTMNTSDQSLFPMDSAFKRRWEWKYIPICKPIKEDGKSFEHYIQTKTKKFPWWSVVEAINKRIRNVTESEDKQLGYWFAAKAEEKIISTETFVSKVLFYIWNDVFKDFGKDSEESPFIFDNDLQEFSKFYNFDGSYNSEMVDKFIENLDITPIYGYLQ